MLTFVGWFNTLKVKFKVASSLYMSMAFTQILYNPLCSGSNLFLDLNCKLFRLNSIQPGSGSPSKEALKIKKS